MVRILRFLLLPLSLPYFIITAIRNWLFDKGILSSYQSGKKVLVVGNLSTGGTGKTPFVEFLIRKLEKTSELAVVSRGYGRQTKGLHWVENTNITDQVGDEALQIKRKFSQVPFAVHENRVAGIQAVEKRFPQTELIILDDAFQHRYVQADCWVLLTTYEHPFFKDFILPAGNLRESSSGKKRAHVIVVTKCPAEMSDALKEKYLAEIKPAVDQQVFFSQLKYGSPYYLKDNAITDLSAYQSILLVSGIAGNTELVTYLHSKVKDVEVLSLRDHVRYDTGRVEDIITRFEKMKNNRSAAVVSTEKDAVKLLPFMDQFRNVPVLILPVEIQLTEEETFLTFIKGKLNKR